MTRFVISKYGVDYLEKMMVLQAGGEGKLCGRNAYYSHLQNQTTAVLDSCIASGNIVPGYGCLQSAMVDQYGASFVLVGRGRGCYSTVSGGKTRQMRQ